MTHRTLAAACLLAAITPAGCTDAPPPVERAGDGPLAVRDREPAAVRDAPEPAAAAEAATSQLVVHEWGTFTSVQGSDGRSLDGLHHEEEALPKFVHRRDPASAWGKGMEALPEGVTQKLETPVIYFYSREVETVSVDVRFPQGIFGEWYPRATAWGPPLGTLDQIADGSMRWEVSLRPDLDRRPIPWVAADDVWAPSRAVAADPVEVDGETERFLFYRGLGRFDLPLRVTSEEGGVFTLRNDSSETIPGAVALHRHPGGGRAWGLGPVAPGEVTTTAVPPPKEEPIPYLEHARDLLLATLTEAGLFEEEAAAMVDTWSRSWFDSDGLRVLYVVPRPWTDALLPLTLTPEPDELVRTLVGRVEILTPEEERRVVADVRRTATGGEGFDWEALGRFGEAKLRRAAALLGEEGDDHAWRTCDALAEEAASRP